MEFVLKRGSFKQFLTVFLILLKGFLRLVVVAFVSYFMYDIFFGESEPKDVTKPPVESTVVDHADVETPINPTYTEKIEKIIGNTLNNAEAIIKSSIDEQYKSISHGYTVVSGSNGCYSFRKETWVADECFDNYEDAKHLMELMIENDARIANNKLNVWTDIGK